MIDKGLYEQLETELSLNRIEEEAEDILLELSEILADKGIHGKEVHHSEKFGSVLIEVCGICTPAEEEPEEADVWLKWIKIGKKKFEIEDYFL